MDLVLLLSIPKNLSFLQGHPVAPYVFLSLLSFLSFNNTFWNGVSTPRCDQSSYPSRNKKQYIYIYIYIYIYRGTRWPGWLRHRATSRMVAGSTLDGVTWIFHRFNLSGRTMALGLTRPLRETSTRNSSWRGKGGRWIGVTTLPIVLKSGIIKLLENSQPAQGFLYLYCRYRWVLS